MFFSCSLGTTVHPAVTPGPNYGPGDANLTIQSLSASSIDVFQLSVVYVTINIENSGVFRSSTGSLGLFLTSGEQRINVLGDSVWVESIESGTVLSKTVLIVIPDSVLGGCEIGAELNYLDGLVDTGALGLNVGEIPVETEPNDSRFGDAHRITFDRGYKAAVSTEYDEDWFVCEMDPNTQAGISVDGAVDALTLDFYIDAEGTAFKQFVNDDFSDEVIIQNAQTYGRTLYIRVSSKKVQDYQILFRSVK